MAWLQNYDPAGNSAVSALAGVLPCAVLYGLLLLKRIPAWCAAGAGCVAAAAMAGGVFLMPPQMIAGAGAAGLMYGIVRLGWILLAALWVVRISIASGQFAVVKQSVDSVSAHRGVQAVWIAVAMGTLLEGAGGGAAVAVTCALLAALGFAPLQAAAVSLVGNSASVAFGGMGNPVRALAAAAGVGQVGAAAGIGRMLVPVAVVLPFWIGAMAGKRRVLRRYWAVLLGSGLAFAAVLVCAGKFPGARAVDLVAGTAMLIVPAVLRGRSGRANAPHIRSLLRAWSPFVLLTACIVIWSGAGVTRALDSVSWRMPVPGLHMQVASTPPVAGRLRLEAARFDFPWLATPGTAALLAGLLAAVLAGLRLRKAFTILAALACELRPALLALGILGAMEYITRFAGMEAAVGVSFSKAGPAIPWLAGALGWLGAAFSGTAAGANALYGPLLANTGVHLGLSPLLTTAAGAAGGAMGKMLSAPSLVTAAAATAQPRAEGEVLAAVWKHSVALLLLVSVWFLAIRLLRFPA